MYTCRHVCFETRLCYQRMHATCYCCYYWCYYCGSFLFEAGNILLVLIISILFILINFRFFFLLLLFVWWLLLIWLLFWWLRKIHWVFFMLREACANWNRYWPQLAGNLLAAHIMKNDISLLGRSLFYPCSLTLTMVALLAASGPNPWRCGCVCQLCGDTPWAFFFVFFTLYLRRRNHPPNAQITPAISI